MSDALHSLRRMDFPSSAKAALQHLESVYGGQGNIPGLSEDAHEQIVEECIFMQHSSQGKSRSSHSKKLTSVQELQLLEIIMQYYKNQANEWARNAIFRALFGGSSLGNHRLLFLQKFISMAVGIGCANVLNSAGAWMQVQGCGNDNVTSVAKVLVNDYCSLVSATEGVLADLPNISPIFTCNLITAITHVYQPTAYKNNPAIPVHLLSLITKWISDNPHLCLCSLHHGQNAYLQPQRTNLWTSPTKPNTQTPVPGLVRWCTKAPLLNILYPPKDHSQEIMDMHALWSHLHLAVLECVLSFPNTPGAPQLELVTLGDMNRIVKSVSSLVKTLPKDCPTAPVEVATDRLVQVLQVALATGGFRCSLADLKSIFSSIPPNRLLEVLTAQHLSTAPPQMHNARS